MDILFAVPEYGDSAGGIASYYTTLIPEITSQGHSVDVLVGSAFTSAIPSYEEHGAQVEYLDPERREKVFATLDAYEALPNLRRTLAAAWALFDQADRGAEYDVVETTDFGLLFLPWVAFDDTPPTLVQLHASNGQIDAHEPTEGKVFQGHFTRFLECRGLERADALQSVSPMNAQEWEERVQRTVTSCPPPLDVTAVNASEMDTNTADGFVAGRIQYWKGPTVLCDALTRLGDRAPQIEWAGRDTDYRAADQSMTEFLKRSYSSVWGQMIRPVGQIPREEVLRRQATAEFVVVPSIWDVFNYTAVEAMAMGTVVICSEGAGAANLIESRRNGFRVPAEDPATLAETIRKVTALSYDERARIGKKAQETVATQLDPQRIAERRVETYRSMSPRDGVGGDPEWIRETIRPKGAFDVPSKPLAFLDHLPLRELINYVARRTARKIGRTIGLT